MTAEDKARAVLRLLRGEDPHAVARELDVSTGRIENWKTRFVQAGREELRNSGRHRRWRLWNESQRVLPWLALVLALLLTVWVLLNFAGNSGGETSAAPAVVTIS